MENNANSTPAPPTTDDSEQPPPSYESLSTTGLEHLPQTTNSPTTANTAATSELIVQSQADGVGVGEHAPEPEDGPLPPPYSPGMRRNASTNAGTAHEEGSGAQGSRAPPSYRSIFGQRREVREERREAREEREERREAREERTGEGREARGLNSARPSTSRPTRGRSNLERKLWGIILGPVGCTLILVALLTVPITVLVMGVISVGLCRSEPYIPLFLVIMGLASLAANVMLIAEVIVRPKSSTVLARVRHPKILTWTWRIANLLLYAFLLAWLLTGSYWVYSIRDEVMESDYEDCSEPVYKFSLIFITAAHILILVGILCVVLVAIVAKYAFNKRVKRRINTMLQTQRGSIDIGDNETRAEEVSTREEDEGRREQSENRRAHESNTGQQPDRRQASGRSSESSSQETRRREEEGVGRRQEGSGGRRESNGTQESDRRRQQESERRRDSNTRLETERRQESRRRQRGLVDASSQVPAPEDIVETQQQMMTPAREMQVTHEGREGGGSEVVGIASNHEELDLFPPASEERRESLDTGTDSVTDVRQVTSTTSLTNPPRHHQPRDLRLVTHHSELTLPDMQQRVTLAPRTSHSLMRFESCPYPNHSVRHSSFGFNDSSLLPSHSSRFRPLAGPISFSQHLSQVQKNTHSSFRSLCEAYDLDPRHDCSLRLPRHSSFGEEGGTDSNRSSLYNTVHSDGFSLTTV